MATDRNGKTIIAGDDIAIVGPLREALSGSRSMVNIRQTPHICDDGDVILASSILVSGSPHAELSALDVDDHTIYLLADGSRAWTGDMDAAGFDLTDVATMGIGQSTVEDGFLLDVGGDIFADGGASPNGDVRLGQFCPWFDKRFGMGLHYDGDYALAVWGGNEAGDVDAIRFGTYAAAATAQSAFNELMVLSKSGNLGVGLHPSEQIHSGAKIRADGVFNHNGADGATASVNAGGFTTLEFSGGIFTGTT